MDKHKPQEPEAVRRARQEWNEMEREVEQEAHDLVQSTPSRAEDDEPEEEA
ncbi:hypothetical protein JST97_03860 [bacterium]|nr:hypothetical protein [bacterium]